MRALLHAVDHAWQALAVHSGMNINDAAHHSAFDQLVRVRGAARAPVTPTSSAVSGWSGTAVSI